MATDRPDPGEFLELAQRMLRELFAGPRSGEEPWAEATRNPGEPAARALRSHEPSPEEQRVNLTFALATRAVEALEDLALDVAAIRQRLERTAGEARRVRPETEGQAPGAVDAPHEQPPTDPA